MNPSVQIVGYLVFVQTLQLSKMKKPAHKDTEHPAGCYVFPAESLTKGSEQLVKDLSRRTTWQRPLKGGETPEEAYARGWADAVHQYEAGQLKAMDYGRKLWWEDGLV